MQVNYNCLNLALESIVMKKLYSLAVFCFLSIAAFCQVGNVVLIYTSNPFNLNPTPVDSTSTVSFMVHNTAGGFQQVTFTTTSNISVTPAFVDILAGDSAEVEVSFTPTSIGIFNDTLSWSSSFFGEGDLFLIGEGVLPVIAVDNDSIVFPNTSLGALSQETITITNNGNGTMSIDSIISDNSFITTSSTSFLIPEGQSQTIDILFNPLSAGVLNSTITIYSNDPNNPSFQIDLYGAAVSQVSGSLCNSTWTASNSPYTLTDKLIIPEGCTLTIEPGVQVNLENNLLRINGHLIANGTSNDSIYFSGGTFFIDSASTVNMKYWSAIGNSYPIDTIYYEDFSDGNWNGESRDSYGNSYGDSFFEWNHDSGTRTCGRMSSFWNWKNRYAYSGEVKLDNSSVIDISEAGTYRFSFEYVVGYSRSNNASNNADAYMEAFYSIDGGNNWIKFHESQRGNNETDALELALIDSLNLNVGDQFNYKIVQWCGPTADYWTTTQHYYDNILLEKIAPYNSSGAIKNVIFNETFEDTLSFENNWKNNTELNDSPLLSNGYLDYDDYSSNIAYIDNNDAYNSNNSLRITSDNNGGSGIFSKEIYIPADDTYYISFMLKTHLLEDCGEYYIYWFYSDQVEWNHPLVNHPGECSQRIFKHSRHHCTTYGWTHDWHNRKSILGHFKKGQKIVLYIMTNQNNPSVTSADNVDFSIDNIEIIGSGLTNTILHSRKTDLIVSNSKIDIPIYVTGNNMMIDVDSSRVNHTSISGDNSSIDLFNSTVVNSLISGLASSGNNNNINLQYSFVRNNDIGIEMTGSGTTSLNSSMVTNNGYGIHTEGRVNTNYSNITFNSKTGIYFTGNNFNNIKNSILWGNDITSYNQIHSGSGVTSITYSTVQGSGAYGTSGGQYYYGDGSIDDDPVFADQTTQHMSSFSNCVDAATPWEQDANMPYGLGGVRADVGIYGGPDNWYWGGTPVPDGSPVLSSIQDIPQDQGGNAAIVFDASVWDNSSLVNNVTHYSIWRNFDANGSSIDSVQQGQWELMGDMPAQSFNAYAFTAPTLGDSSITAGMFENCYVVIAHTQDSGTYWYSNVMCGYSIDNIAPSVPTPSAIPINTNDVMVYWETPTDYDYSYSTVFSDAGYVETLITDTLSIDATTLAGSSYTYGVVHYDVNGNPSDTGWVTIAIDNDEDIIPLKAGWNLISTNKTPSNNNMQDIFSSLVPGNLIYVTSFNLGSVYYDPNGLSFFNTLHQFDDGYAYWVKVYNDDTLTVIGTDINLGYNIPLNAGWNLSGYLENTPQDPSSYFNSLITNNNLVYVTSYDQGSFYYDPNGLPFLNTLLTMERPFGYWVKVNNSVVSNSYRLENEFGVSLTPNFMFINGKSNLTNFEGEYVYILNSNFEPQAKLEILSDGYLMTTSLYGDDLTTSLREGFREKEILYFSFNGEIIESDIVFQGNMERKEVDLVFGEGTNLNIIPNPINDFATINFTTSQESLVSIDLHDITGRKLQNIKSDLFDEGVHSITWNSNNISKGVYFIRIRINNHVQNKKIIIN